MTNMVIYNEAIENLRSLPLLTNNLIYKEYDAMDNQSIPKKESVCQVDRKLTQARLKGLLHYEPKTGLLTWRKLHSGVKYAGVEAGHRAIDGYRKIKTGGKVYAAHRLAWFYMEGYFPENQIDHIDRVRDNNRWNNLRVVSGQCQMRNRKVNSNNKSGIKGVMWRERDKRWVVTIRFNNKTKHLGHYKDFDSAVCARLAAEQCLTWNRCESTSSAYKYVKENIQGVEL